MIRARTSQCLIYAFRESRMANQAQVQQWTSRATLNTKIKSHGSKATGRPMRMDLALAKDVGFHPNPSKPNRNRVDGPFAGMNQRAPPRSAENRPPRLGRKREPLEERAKNRGFKALKMQRVLAPVSYNQRTSIKEQIKEIDSFELFPLIHEVQTSINTQALADLKYTVPTPIQRIAIPALLGSLDGKQKKNLSEKKEFLLAAETGSGKTLAYVLPILNAIKIAEMNDPEFKEYDESLKMEAERQSQGWNMAPPLTNMPHPSTGRPRAIILVPTAELVEQVGKLVKLFSHTVKFRAALISSIWSGTVIRNRLFTPKGIDVVVSTPHLLSSIADSVPNILSRVTHLVIDEADSLLDRGFAPLTTAIIDRATPSLKQLILCSATIPKGMDAFLRKRFPDMHRLVTPNLHAIPRRVQLGVIDVEKDPYRGNKNLACADSIWSIGKASSEHDGPVKGMVDLKRILVFVNEREKAKELAEYLMTKGVDAVALSRDTPEERKAAILGEYTTDQVIQVPKGDHPGSLVDNQPNYLPFGQEAPPVKRMLPNTRVLVTTDLGSRGIDTLAVRHVILYDVPHSTVDFIHRLGRMGRMGRRGRGIVLVGKHDRRDVVAEVREGMFMGKALI
ncbi:hypothetical protein B7494_g4154 [Chlorociboria aeruginascens]|nr:hypothetical protein B7494_g4154 [Chlorociboria aeruginascens]